MIYVCRFLENLSQKRRQKADSTGALGHITPDDNAPIPSIIVGRGKPIDNSSKLKNSSRNGINSVLQNSTVEVAQVVTCVEEFIPDGGYIDKSFLEEPVLNSKPQCITDSHFESDR